MERPIYYNAYTTKEDMIIKPRLETHKRAEKNYVSGLGLKRALAEDCDWVAIRTLKENRVVEEVSKDCTLIGLL